jgi:type VI secretion system protein ImpF
MSELAPKERLQPCLLDRLTDDEPTQKMESRERRVISMQRYREAVLRDIGWILNSSAHVEDEEISHLERVKDSVLNYGLRSVCGVSLTGAGVADVEQRILAAIRTFEPRVLKNTLSVKAQQDPGSSHQPVAVQFQIKGELWAQGAPEALYIKTEVDLETGQCELKRGANG